MRVLPDTLWRSLNGLLVVLLALGPAAPRAFAQAVAADARPEIDQVVAGDVRVLAPDGNLTTIEASDGSIADYRSFDIGRDWRVLVEISRNDAPAPDGAHLARVNSGAPTEILGRLESNGRVYLQNPAGILVGQGATIDVAGFHAAAGQIDAGTFRSQTRDDYAEVVGNVDVRGEVKANVVQLIGKHVLQQGAIVTTGEGGEVVIVAGEKVTILSSGFAVSIEGIGEQVQELLTGVEIRGSIDAGTDGRVFVGAGDLYGTAIRFARSPAGDRDTTIDAAEVSIEAQAGPVELDLLALRTGNATFCAASDCAGGQRSLAAAAPGEVRFGDGAQVAVLADRALRDPAENHPGSHPVGSFALRQTADIGTDVLAPLLYDTLTTPGTARLDVSLSSDGDVTLDQHLSARLEDFAAGGELRDLSVRAGQDLHVNANQRVARNLSFRAGALQGEGAELVLGASDPVKLDGETVTLDASRERIAVAIPEGREPRVVFGDVSIGDAQTERVSLVQEASIRGGADLPGAGRLRAEQLSVRSRLGNVSIDAAAAETLGDPASLELRAFETLEVHASLAARDSLDLLGGEFGGGIEVGEPDATTAVVLDAPRLGLRAGVGQTVAGDEDSPRVVLHPNAEFGEGVQAFAISQDAIVAGDDLPERARFRRAGGVEGLDYTVESQVSRIELDDTAAARLAGADLTLRSRPLGTFDRTPRIELDDTAAARLAGADLTLRSRPLGTFDRTQRIDIDTDLEVRSLRIEGFATASGDLVATGGDIHAQATEERNNFTGGVATLTLDGSDGESPRDQRLAASGEVAVVGSLLKTGVGNLLLEGDSIDLDENGLSARVVRVDDGDLELRGSSGIFVEGDLDTPRGQLRLGHDLVLDGSPALVEAVDPGVGTHAQSIRGERVVIPSDRTITKTGGGDLRISASVPSEFLTPLSTLTEALADDPRLGSIEVAGRVEVDGVVPTFDEEGAPIVDDAGDPVTTTLTSLLSLRAQRELLIDGEGDAELSADFVDLAGGGVTNPNLEGRHVDVRLGRARIDARQLFVEAGSEISDSAIGVSPGFRVRVRESALDSNGDTAISSIGSRQDAPVDALSQVISRDAIEGALDRYQLQSQQNVTIDAAMADAISGGATPDTATAGIDVESRLELAITDGRLRADSITLESGLLVRRGEEEVPTDLLLGLARDEAGALSPTGGDVILEAREIQLGAGDGIGLESRGQVRANAGALELALRPAADPEAEVALARLAIRQDEAIGGASALLPVLNGITGVAPEDALSLTLQSRDRGIAIDDADFASVLSGPDGNRHLELHASGRGSAGELRVGQALRGRSIRLDSGDEALLSVDGELDAARIELHPGRAIEFGAGAAFRDGDRNPERFALRKNADLDQADLPAPELFQEGSVAGLAYAISSADALSIAEVPEPLAEDDPPAVSREGVRAKIEGTALELGADAIEIGVGPLALESLHVESGASQASFDGSLDVEGDVRLESPVELNVGNDAGAGLAAGGSLVANSGLRILSSGDVSISSDVEIDLTGGPLEYRLGDLPLPPAGGRSSFEVRAPKIALDVVESRLATTDLLVQGEERVDLFGDLLSDGDLRIVTQIEGGVIRTHNSNAPSGQIRLEGNEVVVASPLVGVATPDEEAGAEENSIELGPVRNVAIEANRSATIHGARLNRLDVEAQSAELRGELTAGTLTVRTTGGSVGFDPGTIRSDIVALDTIDPVELGGVNLRRVDDERAPRSFFVTQQSGIDDERTGDVLAALGDELDDTTLGLTSTQGQVVLRNTGALDGLRLTLGGRDGGAAADSHGVQVEGDLAVERLQLDSSAQIRGDVATEGTLVARGEALRVTGDARVGGSLQLDRPTPPSPGEDDDGNPLPSAPPDQTVDVSGVLAASSISKPRGSLVLGSEGSPGSGDAVRISGDVEVSQGGLVLHDGLRLSGDLAARDDVDLRGNVTLTGGAAQTLESTEGVLVTAALVKNSGALRLAGNARSGVGADAASVLEPGVRLQGVDEAGVAVQTRAGDLTIDGAFEVAGDVIARGGDLRLTSPAGDGPGRLTDPGRDEWRLAAPDGSLETSGGLEAGDARLVLETGGTLGIGGTIETPGGIELQAGAVETVRDTRLVAPELALPAGVRGEHGLSIEAGSLALEGDVALGRNAALELQAESLTLATGAASQRLKAGSVVLNRDAGATILSPAELTIEATNGNVEVGRGQTIVTPGSLLAKATGTTTVAGLRALDLELDSTQTTLLGGTLLGNHVEIAGSTIAGSGTIVVPTVLDYVGPTGDGIVVRLTSGSRTRLTAENLADFVATGPSTRESARDLVVESDRQQDSASEDLAQDLGAAVAARPLWAEELVTYLERAALQGPGASSAGLQDPRFARPELVALLKTYRGLLAPVRQTDPLTGEVEIRSHASRIRSALERAAGTCDASGAAALADCLASDPYLGEARFYLETLATLVEQARAAGLGAAELERFVDELSGLLRPESLPESTFRAALLAE